MEQVRFDTDLLYLFRINKKTKQSRDILKTGFDFIVPFVPDLREKSSSILLLLIAGLRRSSDLFKGFSHGMSIIGGPSGTAEKKAMLELLGSACREWGMFQMVNHDISPTLLDAVKRVSFSYFFYLPMEEKLKYANDPVTYEGYGSRTGIQKGLTLDWNDYFYHFIRPVSAINRQKKWPQ